MGYSTKSALTEKICDEIEWNFSMGAIKTMKRKGKIYVRGTALKVNEARDLAHFCNQRSYIYKGPFAD